MILALETSCDETSAAVVDGFRVWSNIVSSQADLHRKWGGVVPEVAARAHVEAILPVIEEAVESASISLAGVTGVAVTNRPGLIGALSVGVSAAKALSFGLGVPLIGIHHLEGHLLSPFARLEDDGPEIPFPHLALIVSGGHTEIVRVAGFGDYDILGQTIDDAAGEAFDKSARLLGMPYPGGRALQEAAVGGDPKRYSLPRALPDDPFNFSFSGLKTAVLRLVEREGAELRHSDAAASIQEAIVSVLVQKALSAVDSTGARMLTLVGGVAANDSLRERLSTSCRRSGVGFMTPPPELCTDNAAMIGIAGSIRLANGERDGFGLDCYSSADLPAATTGPVPS